MHSNIKKYLSLSLWIVILLVIGSLSGSLTKTEVVTWYSTLNRSPFTPANAVFPIAWTILYILIGVSGWRIWDTSPFPRSKLIKNLYIIQLLLNWSWTPLFFYYHFIGSSLICLLLMDILVTIIIYRTYASVKSVSLFMSPYLGWILFATYLNFYIWQHNNII